MDLGRPSNSPFFAGEVAFLSKDGGDRGRGREESQEGVVKNSSRGRGKIDNNFGWQCSGVRHVEWGRELSVKCSGASKCVVCCAVVLNGRRQGKGGEEGREYGRRGVPSARESFLTGGWGDIGFWRAKNSHTTSPPGNVFAEIPPLPKINF